MAEEIAGLLGVKSEAIEGIVKILGIIVGAIIFLLFFAFLPMYAVILFGFLTVIASIYFGNDKGVYAGVGMLAIGLLAIFIPQISEQLYILSRMLNEMLVYPI